MDGIKQSKAPYSDDCLVIVKIPEKKHVLDKRIHKEYVIETTKGQISFSLTSSPFLKALIQHYYMFEGLKVGWLSKNVVTFGPVDMSFLNFPVTRDARTYKTWDIFLSFGGFDPANLHLCFSKKDHSGQYGTPDEPLNGVVGRVIQGGHIIPLLRKTDAILTFTPLTIHRKRVLQLRSNELETEEITPGMEIYTYLSIKFNETAKYSVDHFLAITEAGKFQVDEASSMFIKNHKFKGAKIPTENPVFRQNGTITVRNQGYDVGSVYIYKNNTSFSHSHNVIGRINPKTLPIIENANPGANLLIQTSPISLNFIGKTQEFTSDYLKPLEITHKRVGDESDGAVIVEQRPQTTMDVWHEKTCVTLGLSPEQIVKFKLFHEDTPLSIQHFKKNASMLYYPIGKFQVLDNMQKLIMFLPVDGESIEAIPRESEIKEVPVGAIGVTNALRRLTGSIGVRLEASNSYGPTGETFEGTNVIGQVVSGLEFLAKLETGDLVWFMEVQDGE